MTIRLVGLSSGLDTDSLVSQLMTAERIPLQKLQQKKALLEYQTDTYRNINTSLMKLRDSISSLRYSSNISGFKATSADTSKVTATASNSATTYAHSIQVNQLASGAKATGTSLGAGASLSGNAISTDVTITAGVNDRMSITLGSTQKVITLSEGTYNATQLKEELQRQLNTAFGSNRINANLTSGSISLSATGTTGYEPPITLNEVNGGLSAIGFADKTSSKLNLNMTVEEAGAFLGSSLTNTDTAHMSINGVKIEFSKTDTLQQVINKVNNSSAGVTMSYDSITNAFTLASKTTGVASQIQLDNGTSNLFSALKFDTSQTYTGKDAIVEVDGVTSYRDSNTFTIDGVTYSVFAETTSPVSINVAPDTSGLLDKIKSFVDTYNEAIGLVNKTITEKKAYGYDPLTNEQREEMTETEQELWDAKVKQGILKNDTVLNKVSRELRGLLSSEVSGLPNELNSFLDIGLSTTKYSKGQYSSEDAGKIVIDEAALTKAINDNPEAVNQMFTKFVATDSTDNGIAHRMYDTLNTAISEVIKKAGRTNGLFLDASTSIGKQAVDLENKIQRMEDRLDSREDFYYKQFSAMEKAIANGNSTLSWLTSQF